MQYDPFLHDKIHQVDKKADRAKLVAEAADKRSRSNLGRLDRIEKWTERAIIGAFFAVVLVANFGAERIAEIIAAVLKLLL